MGLGHIFSNTIHLPGLRGNPERTYRIELAPVPGILGTFENYAASHHSQVAGDKR